MTDIKDMLASSLKEAENLLKKQYKSDVVTTYASDGLEAAVWLEDKINGFSGPSSSIGICIRLRNKRLKSMPEEELAAISHEEFIYLLDHPDMLEYESAICIRTTDNKVIKNSRYLNQDTEFKSFSTLEDATSYLFKMAKRIKMVFK